MNTILRKFRYVPIQFVLMGAALLIFVMYRSSPKVRLEDKWSEFRDEELKKYENVKEVDIKFLRKVSRMDQKIEDLTEKDLNRMNITQLMVALHSFLDNTDAICGRRIRMGSMGAGGWEVCDDDLIRPKAAPCLVYSFGSLSDFAFEDDIARVFKCEVHSFSTNIEDEGDYNRTDLIYVHPFGVSKYTEMTPEGKELYTLGDIRAILGHKKRNIDVIKLDLENTEWSALEDMLDEDELKNVRQVLVQYHVGTEPTDDKLRRMLRILQGMSEEGFRKFYAHKGEKGLYHHPSFPVARSKSYDIHYLNENFRRRKQPLKKPKIVKVVRKQEDEDEEDEEP